MRCSLRHGFFADRARDGALTYLLDFDVYREGLSVFDPEDLILTADTFNVLAVQLFKQAVTPQMLELLT